jgi:hypothetical protein
MESLAGHILTYNTQQIPDLLQTKAYAFAVAEASAPAPNGDAARRSAEATLTRQRAILEAREPELTVPPDGMVCPGLIVRRPGVPAGGGPCVSGCAQPQVTFAAPVRLQLRGGRECPPCGRSRWRRVHRGPGAR